MDILKGENCFYIGDTNSPLGQIDYAVVDGVLDIVDIRLRPTLRGQGIGSDLVQAVIEFAAENEYKLNPDCIYVENYSEEEVVE